MGRFWLAASHTKTFTLVQLGAVFGFAPTVAFGMLVRGIADGVFVILAGGPVNLLPMKIENCDIVGNQSKLLLWI